jgi:hypothetical protein
VNGPSGPADDGQRPVTVALSSSSVYPLSVHDAFAVAQDLAFDGVVVAEISTRRARFPGEREAWLAETLGLARRHLSRPLVAAHRLWGPPGTHVSAA